MQLYGTLFDAGGPLPHVTIVFTAERTTLNGVIVGADRSFTTQEDGTYSIALEPGYYSVYWLEKGKRVRLGHLVADIDSEMSLPEALEADYTPMQPSYIQGALDQMLAYLADAESRIGTSQELVDAKNAAAASASAASTDAADAQQAADDAQDYRDGAAVAGKIYADAAAGLAATGDTEYFKAVSTQGDGFLDLFRNDNNSATPIDTFPSLNGLATAVRDANQKATRLARSLQRLGDNGQTLHSDFAYDAYGLGSRMSGGVDTALAGEELWTVERATSKWVEGPNGLLREVPPNTIARKWRNGVPQGALIEEDRTNLLLWSEDFTQGKQFNNCTAELSSVESPVSGTNYTKIIPDDQLSKSDIYIGYGLSTSRTVASGSLIVRGGGGVSIVRVTIGSRFSPFIRTKLEIDLDTGEYSESISPNIINGAVSVIPLSDGSFRVSCTGGQDDDNGFLGIRISPREGTLGNSSSFTGDGSSFFYATALQLEEGTTPSSYIPTTDSPVTRAADMVKRTDAGELNSAAGTLFIVAKGVVPARNTGFGKLYEISDGTSDNRLYAIRRMSGGYSLYVFSGGVQQDSFINTDLGDDVKIAVAWQDGGDTLTYVNGSLVNSGSDIAAPLGLDRISVGNSQGVLFIGSAHIEFAEILPYAMPAAELEAMTL